MENQDPIPAWKLRKRMIEAQEEHAKQVPVTKQENNNEPTSKIWFEVTMQTQFLIKALTKKHGLKRKDYLKKLIDDDAKQHHINITIS